MRRVLYVFFAVSLFVAVWSVAELLAEGRTLFWQQVPAKVSKSEVELVFQARSVSRSARPTDTNWFRWNFEYTYSVAGLDHRSDRASLMDTPVWNRKSAEAMAAKYPVGTPVLAYVSPDDPELAILEPGFTAGSVFLMASSLSAAIGSMWMLNGMPTKRRRG